MTIRHLSRVLAFSQCCNARIAPNVPAVLVTSTLPFFDIGRGTAWFSPHRYQRACAAGYLFWKRRRFRVFRISRFLRTSALTIVANHPVLTGPRMPSRGEITIWHSEISTSFTKTALMLACHRH